MIELVKYGTLTQDKSFLVLTSIVMLFTVWRSIILLGKFKDFRLIIYLRACFSDKIVTGSFDKKAKIWDA
jgi:hypothetical protein